MALIGSGQWGGEGADEVKNGLEMFGVVGCGEREEEMTITKCKCYPVKVQRLRWVEYLGIIIRFNLIGFNTFICFSYLT